jgi:PIN domain nuclease of toxin-antitoxin system
MRLLLDTHTFLWLVEDNPNLSRAAKDAIADPRNQLYLSTASLWELAIKVGKGKLALNPSLELFVDHWMPIYLLQLLDIQKSHALLVARLPRHHGDPFDRLLIAQATSEQLTLVSGDAHFAAYQVPTIW